ncbi:hypothetical protein HDU82_004159 [Entophlyctis luteolus]|nr:hypothetical protein HDU82_004159 [Entophlyctis luteolus]
MADTKYPLAADGDLLETRWNWVTIVISIAISYTGAIYAILFNESRARTDPPHSYITSVFLLVISSISVSVRAIFFMHFVGMTAVTAYVKGTDIQVPIYFDIYYTVLSAIICCLVVLGCFIFVSQDHPWNDIVQEREKMAEKVLAHKIENTLKPKKRWRLQRKQGPDNPPPLPSTIPLAHLTPLVENDSLREEEPLRHEKGHSGTQTIEGVRKSQIQNRRHDVLATRRLLEVSDAPHKQATPAHNPETVSFLAQQTDEHQHNPNSSRHNQLSSYAGVSFLSINKVQANKAATMTTEKTTTTLELEIEFLVLLERPWRILVSGIIIACAVLAMHHLGMYSMRMEAVQHFSTPIVALSVVIAVVAATAGMFIIFRILPYYPNDILKIIAAVIIAVAVNGMHYTGMASLSFTYRFDPDFDASAFIEPVYLGEVILYSEVILNILFETILRSDHTAVLSLMRARIRAVAGSIDFLAPQLESFGSFPRRDTDVRPRSAGISAVKSNNEAEEV